MIFPGPPPPGPFWRFTFGLLPRILDVTSTCAEAGLLWGELDGRAFRVDLALPFRFIDASGRTEDLLEVIARVKGMTRREVLQGLREGFGEQAPAAVSGHPYQSLPNPYP